jgi:hypothetical protein
MNNHFLLRDQDIVDLLDDLQSAEQASYPALMQERQRAAFVALATNQPGEEDQTPPPVAFAPKPIPLHSARLDNIWLWAIGLAALAAALLGIFIYKEDIRAWLFPTSSKSTLTAPGQTVTLRPFTTTTFTPTFSARTPTRTPSPLPRSSVRQIAATASAEANPANPDAPAAPEPTSTAGSSAAPTSTAAPNIAPTSTTAPNPAPTSTAVPQPTNTKPPKPDPTKKTPPGKQP